MVHIDEDGYYLIVDLGGVAAARLLMWGRAYDLARTSMSVSIWRPCTVSLRSFVLVLLTNTSCKGDRWLPNPCKLQSCFGGESSLVAKPAKVAEFCWRGAIAAHQIRASCRVVFAGSNCCLPISPMLQSGYGEELSLVAKSAQVAELFWHGVIAGRQFCPCCPLFLAWSTLINDIPQEEQIY